MKVFRGLLVAVLLTLPVQLLALAPTQVGACPTTCMSEKEHCVAKLGAPAEDNCKDGMRICIERCNPKGQNTAAFDAAESIARNARTKPFNPKIRACEQRCEVSSTVCVRSGPTSSNACGLGRQSCLDRCYGK